MEQFKRTITCGVLSAQDAGKNVVLNGWVHRFRDHGGVRFIDLRDRSGISQVVVNDEASITLRETVAALKFEYCIAVVGVVQQRPDSMVNPAMPTGEIEVVATDIQVLSTAETLPFVIDERTDAREELRLKYRYLDLRSFSMQRKIKLRHDVAFRVREYLVQNGFYEIETPTMIRSTPEGARDFLVPSRLHPGKFYALPQSPQLFKQILMVSGFDRYFQIAHCFRDEDARGDRQIEHTQIDIEMSFVSKDDVFAVAEGMFQHIFASTLSIELPHNFPRISYDDALNRYGSDKPDLRFGWEMHDFQPYVADCGFRVFEACVGEGGAVKVLVAKGCAEYSRKQISELEDVAKTYGAQGLAWMKCSGDRLDGGIAKFFAERSAAIYAGLQCESGDLLLFVADSWKVACTALGAVRSRLGKDLKLADPQQFAFAWIVDFPLFEFNAETGGWEAAHHMFSMPQERYIENMESDPGSVKGDLYDLVCNGYELASGSIRIHDPALQRRIFTIVGFDPAEAERRFGFLTEAFRYGAPPHGGIAPGLDRLVMLMARESSIREVIAFPKNTTGISPLDDSPSEVDEQQLRELSIQIRPKDQPLPKED